MVNEHIYVAQVEYLKKYNWNISESKFNVEYQSKKCQLWFTYTQTMYQGKSIVSWNFTSISCITWNDVHNDNTRTKTCNGETQICMQHWISFFFNNTQTQYQTQTNCDLNWNSLVDDTWRFWLIGPCSQNTLEICTKLCSYTTVL